MDVIPCCPMKHEIFEAFKPFCSNPDDRFMAAGAEDSPKSTLKCYRPKIWFTNPLFSSSVKIELSMNCSGFAVLAPA